MGLAVFAVMCRSAMEDMLQATAVKIGDMIVVEGIKDMPACFAGFDEPHLAQLAQMVGNGRLG